MEFVDTLRFACWFIVTKLPGMGGLVYSIYRGPMTILVADLLENSIEAFFLGPRCILSPIKQLVAVSGADLGGFLICIP